MAAKTADKSKKKSAASKAARPKARQRKTPPSKGPPTAHKRPAKAAPKLKLKTPPPRPAKKAPEKQKAQPKPAPARPEKRPGKAALPQPTRAGKPADARAAKIGKALEAPAKGKSAKPPVKKRLMVGQKPRSAKPSEAIVPSNILAQQKANPSVSSPAIKPTPASLEAKQSFKVNDSIVYPAHGVGRIVAIEKQVIAGIANELFLIEFEQEKMKLRVPTAKAKAVGMRGLSENSVVKKAIETLKGRARIKRTMWSRRAQEYEQKINSGDIMQVAEVVRDLFRASDQPEQSYSERQLFEAALDRLAREVAAVHKTDLSKAIAELESALAAKKAA